MNAAPVAYTSSYEDARVLWSLLRVNGIRSRVRPVPVGRYPYALEVAVEVLDTAADLAHDHAQRLKLALHAPA